MTPVNRLLEAFKKLPPKPTDVGIEKLVADTLAELSDDERIDAFVAATDIYCGEAYRFAARFLSNWGTGETLQ